MNKQPQQPINYIAGHQIQPQVALLHWLNSTTTGKRVKLPVVIHYQDDHHLAIGKAYIGSNADEYHADSIHLRLDTSTMGISLLTQLRSRVPDDVSAFVIWLEGYWGLSAMLTPDNIKVEAGQHLFQVRTVGELITDTETARTIFIAE